jgi:hypothetical protein
MVIVREYLVLLCETVKVLNIKNPRVCNCDVVFVEREKDVLVAVRDSREISRSTRSVRHLEIATSELGRAELPNRPFFSCIARSGHSFGPHSSLRRRLARAFDATALYMWRSNVLRLRKCSSARVGRHGVKQRCYSSAKSLPISEEEFAGVLDEFLPEILGGDGKPLGMLESVRYWITTDCSTQVSQSAVELTLWRWLLSMRELRGSALFCRRPMASLWTTRRVQRAQKKPSGLQTNCARSVS